MPRKLKNATHLPPTFHTVKKQIHEISKIIAHLPTSKKEEIKNKAPAVHDVCSQIPKADRKDANEKWSYAQNFSSGIEKCMIGFVKGIFTNIKEFVSGSWDLLKLGAKLAMKLAKTQSEMMIGFLKAAYNGSVGTFFAESVAQGSSFFHDIAEKFKVLPQMLFDAILGEYKDFKCLNGPAKTAIVCKSVGYIGTEVAIGILTGGAGIEEMVAVKAAEIAKIVSKSAKVIEVADKVIQFGKVAKKIERVEKVAEKASSKIVKKMKHIGKEAVSIGKNHLENAAEDVGDDLITDLIEDEK